MRSAVRPLSLERQ